MSSPRAHARRPLSLFACAIALASAPSAATAQSVPAAPVTASSRDPNLRVTFAGQLRASGSLVAFLVDEESLGRSDLDGDQLTGDQVLHIFDAAKGTLTNTRFARAFDPTDARTGIAMGDGLVAFLASEQNPAKDLNGDGDTADLVLQVFDASSEKIRSAGLATSSALDSTDPNPAPTSGRRIAFAVPENGQGGMDLNGDGDSSDTILHVFDGASGVVTNLKQAVSSYRSQGNLVVFTISEAEQDLDLNGDDDRSDLVYHVAELDSGRVTNTRLAQGQTFDAVIAGNRVLFTVSESNQGRTDLDRNGSTQDSVLHGFDASSRTVTNIGFSPARSGFAVAGDLVAFLVSEQQRGMDINRDRDQIDFVLHVFDASTGKTTSVDLASGSAGQFAASPDLVAFTVSEGAQGAKDLNGDGDAQDDVIHVFERSTGRVLNTNLAVAGGAANPAVVAGKLVAVRASEAAAGKDLNGNGKIAGDVLHVFDAAAGMTRNLGLIAGPGPIVLTDDLAAFGVSEADQGRDLNGDGDANGTVVVAFDASSGQLTALADTVTGARGPSIAISGRTVIFLASENAQAGGTDLNGDGDTRDVVPQLFDATTGKLSNTALAANMTAFASGAVALVVLEAEQGNGDLDGDGDTLDAVVHVIPLPTSPPAGAAIPPPMPAPPPPMAVPPLRMSPLPTTPPPGS